MQQTARGESGGRDLLYYEEYLVYEWPQVPHGVDEGRGCGCDSFARVLSFLFGCDQESSRPAGRCCRPGTERLRETRGGRAGVRGGHDG